MTRELRQRHRRTWLALAAAVPLVFIVGLFVRRPAPVMHGVGDPLALRSSNLSPR